jgi:hypothetical protein
MPAVVNLAIYSKEILNTDSYKFKNTQMVIISYMVVRIDISNLPSHLRRTLMKEIGLSNRFQNHPIIVKVNYRI